MDPNAALRDLLDALDEGDEWTIEDRVEALLMWINSGGFLPSCFRGTGEAHRLFRHFLDLVRHAYDF